MGNSAAEKAKCYLRKALRPTRRLLGSVAMLAAVAHGQGDQTHLGPRPDAYAPSPSPANVAEAIAKVKSGDFFGVHVEIIARARATEAVPALEEQFLRAQDPLDVHGPLEKEHIASALVRLGDQNPVYWDFLMKSATAAVESGVPDPFVYDAQGKVSSDNSEGLAAWANAHNISRSDAGQKALYKVGAVRYLAMTGDPRATSLLRQALVSRNFMMVSQAALGLAQIGDKDSIPSIIMACQRAPAEAAATIARSLVYFDDPDAQGAVDQYVPKDVARGLRIERAQGKTPFR
jgi:hypothetical protein